MLFEDALMKILFSFQPGQLISNCEGKQSTLVELPLWKIKYVSDVLKRYVYKAMLCVR